MFEQGQGKLSCRDAWSEDAGGVDSKRLPTETRRRAS